MKDYEILLKRALEFKSDSPPPRVVGLVIPPKDEFLVRELVNRGLAIRPTFVRKSREELIVSFDFTYEGLRYFD